MALLYHADCVLRAFFRAYSTTLAVVQVHLIKTFFVLNVGHVRAVYVTITTLNAFLVVSDGML